MFWEHYEEEVKRNIFAGNMVPVFERLNGRILQDWPKQLGFLFLEEERGYAIQGPLVKKWILNDRTKNDRSQCFYKKKSTERASMRGSPLELGTRKSSVGGPVLQHKKSPNCGGSWG